MEPKTKKVTAKKPEDVTPTAEVAVEENEAAVVTDDETETTAVPAPTPIPPQKKSNITTTRNISGEVEIEQPEQIRVDVSGVKALDLVMITMHELIDPAPRIGTFDIRHSLGIQKLVARKNYRLPKFVAEVLVDAGKAEYLSIEG